MNLKGMDQRRKCEDRIESSLLEASRADLTLVYSLAYVSQATKHFGPDDLADIEQKSLSLNADLDITGILVVDEGRILQILEGGKQSVINLFERISKDPRHESVKQVAGSERDHRLLSSWSMVAGQASSTPEDLRADFRLLHDRLTNREHLDDVSAEEVELLKVMALFWSVPI